MAQQLVYLTPEDLAVLKAVIAETKSGRKNAPSRGGGTVYPLEDIQTPDIHLVRAQETIPGIEQTDDETRIHARSCTIYRIDNQWSANPGVTDAPYLSATNRAERVFNTTGIDITPQDIDTGTGSVDPAEDKGFFLAARDKFGNWLSLNAQPSLIREFVLGGSLASGGMVQGFPVNPETNKVYYDNPKYIRDYGFKIPSGKHLGQYDIVSAYKAYSTDVYGDVYIVIAAGCAVAASDTSTGTG